MQPVLFQHFTQSRERLFDRVAGGARIGEESHPGLIPFHADRDLEPAQFRRLQLDVRLANPVAQHHLHARAEFIGKLRFRGRRRHGKIEIRG